jgi:hypothetical protein
MILSNTRTSIAIESTDWKKVCLSKYVILSNTLSSSLSTLIHLTARYFPENIPHRYTEKGNLIGLSEPGNRERGEIIADLTSTFTVLLAIYFPSVTGTKPSDGVSLQTTVVIRNRLIGLFSLETHLSVYH